MVYEQTYGAVAASIMRKRLTGFAECKFGILNPPLWLYEYAELSRKFHVEIWTGGHKGSDRDGNPFLREPFGLSFVSVAALDRPELDADGRLVARDIETTLNK